MSVESYMHRAAKTVLASWLRDWAAKSDDNGFHVDAFGHWAPFRYWRINRGAPHYGVWEEWPIVGDHGVCQVWDETEWPWVAQGLPTPSSLNLDVDDYKMSDQDLACERLLNERPPTFDECIRMAMPPSVILDIAIQHKGSLALGFEVVHRNDVTDRKLSRLKPLTRYGVEIYRVPAHWILAQVGMPKTFVGERIV